MIPQKIWQEVIEKALIEDIGRGDITTDSTIEQTQQGSAKIIARQDGVLAGLAVAEMVFRTIDGQLHMKTPLHDGDSILVDQEICHIKGRIASILKSERVALNFLGHLSGIATLTSQYVGQVAGTRAIITDTRKTTPLLRAMEKEAVVAGGGVNHRMGLYDMILIQENHIRAAGNIHRAVEQTRNFLKQTGIMARIEVETGSLGQVRDALACNVDRIMLNNMEPEDVRKAVKINKGAVEIEASGNINLNNVREIAETGVNYISIDSVTHSAPAFDFSLQVVNL